MRDAFLLVLAFAAFPRPVLAAADKPGTSYPRLMNYYLVKTPPDLAALARYDLVVLSTGVTRAAVDSLRLLNPDIRILAYLSASGVAEGAWQFPDEPSVRVDYEYWQAAEAGGWWLHSTDGSHASDWPGKWNANVSPYCPLHLGQRFSEWLPGFIVDRILEYDPGKWDGVFLDNAWERISFLNAILSSPIDLNRDGQPESSDFLNAWWTTGMTAVVNALRARLGNDYILMENGPNRFYSANGTMVEKFPFNGPLDPNCPFGYAWTHWMLNSVFSYFANEGGFLSAPERANAIHCGWEYGSIQAPQRDANFERFKRFTLGSALLGDGYYALDFDGDIHASLWWEPEYDLPLGRPLGPARRDTTTHTVLEPTAIVWVRDFTNGTVVVNATSNWLWKYPNVPFLPDWDATIVTWPPRPITMLHTLLGTETSADVEWEHPYPPGDSPLEAFEVRISRARIVDEASWSAAVPVPDVPDPDPVTATYRATVFGLTPGETTYIAIRTRDRAGRLSPISPDIRIPPGPVGVPEDGVPAAPSPGRTLVAFPSPFSDRVTLRADRPAPVASTRGGPEGVRSGPASDLDVFDVRGRRIRRLPAPADQDGSLEWSWDGRDDRGRPVPAGTYWARFRVPGGPAPVRLVRIGG